MCNIKNLIHYFITGIISLPKIFISIIIHFFIGIIAILTIFPKYFIIGLKAIFKKDKTIIKKQLKKDNPKKVLIMMVLSFTIYLICIFLISKWTVQQLKIEYLAQTIIDNTEDLIQEEVITPPEIPEEDNNNNEIVNEENTNEETTDTPSNNQEPTKPVYYPNDYWDYINVPLINVEFDELLSKNPERKSCRDFLCRQR